MMTRFISRAGMSVSTVWILAVVFRYFIFYPDMDKLLAFSIIGVLGWLVAFLFDGYSDLKNKYMALGDYLADKPWELKHGKA